MTAAVIGLIGAIFSVALAQWLIHRREEKRYLTTKLEELFKLMAELVAIEGKVYASLVTENGPDLKEVESNALRLSSATLEMQTLVELYFAHLIPSFYAFQQHCANLTRYTFAARVARRIPLDPEMATSHHKNVQGSMTEMRRFIVNNKRVLVNAPPFPWKKRLERSDVVPKQPSDCSA